MPLTSANTQTATATAAAIQVTAINAARAADLAARGYDIEELREHAENATRAKVDLEPMPDGDVCVSVYWPETQGDDGDHCRGHSTILLQAFKVLGALQGAGMEQVAYGGRKDCGHSGGAARFAVGVVAK